MMLMNESLRIDSLLACSDFYQEEGDSQLYVKIWGK